jgi:hypothetical protein
MYVVTHGIQQFTEAAVLIAHLGHSPGEIGFLRFCSDPRSPAPALPPRQPGA